MGLHQPALDLLHGLASGAIRRGVSRPVGYPLQIHEPSGFAWWEINFILCLMPTKWAEWQRGKRIDEIASYLTARMGVQRGEA